jgi:hypothetical protein
MAEGRPKTLFDFADEEPSSVGGGPPSVPPEWDWPLGLRADYIAPEFTFAFVYDLGVLEAAGSFYAAPVLRAVLTGLQQLAKHPHKTMRDQAFTVYHADVLQFGAYVISLGTKSMPVTDFMGQYLKAIHGFRMVDHGTAAPIPIYRYDHGYVIAYTEDLDAEPYVDGAEGFGTGLRLYPRCAITHDDVRAFYLDIKRRDRSIYAKLRVTPPRA